MDKVETDRSISAIVINHNGAEKLREAIVAICAQSLPIQNIVVVDNGSTDNSAESVKDVDPRVRILSLGKNLGLTRARNAGLKAIESKFVLLCDNDVYPAPNALAHLLDTAENENATLVCPRIVYHPNRDTIQTDAARNHFLGLMSMRRADTPVHGAIAETTPVNSAIGACYFLNRKQVLDCGGFNELYFFYFEDLEFALRIRSSGRQIIFNSNAIAYHNRGAGTPGLSFRGGGVYPRLRAELSMRNRLLTIFLHFQSRTLWVLSPVLIAYELATCTYCLLRGWLPDWLKAWYWMLGHRHEIARQRRMLDQARKIGDKHILSGGPIPFASGFLSGAVQKTIVGLLSITFNVYWRLARRLLRD